VSQAVAATVSTDALPVGAVVVPARVLGHVFAALNGRQTLVVPMLTQGAVANLPVTITSTNSTWPEIPPGGGTSVGDTPFAFTLSPSAPCGGAAAPGQRGLGSWLSSARRRPGRHRPRLDSVGDVLIAARRRAASSRRRVAVGVRRARVVPNPPPPTPVTVTSSNPLVASVSVWRASRRDHKS
jgi:hypothetical protein